MEFKPLRFNAPLTQYEAQAEALLDSYEAGEAGAFDVFRNKHPRFLDEQIPCLSPQSPDEKIKDANLGFDDAKLALARCYNFRDWLAVAEYAKAVREKGSPVFRFEAAVEAVVHGDVEALKMLLEEHPELVSARSTRVTNFDPAVHRATLLHYVAANGVEHYRQLSPKNSVEVARLLLEAGAEVDSLADLYGSGCTTMSLLVSSGHPAAAGVQVPLLELLLDFGAAIESTSRWGTPLMAALAFGYPQAAEALARRGARIANLAAAAGMGRLDFVRDLLPKAEPETRHRALTLASQAGHAEVVRLLLDAGENPNRFNPEGNHAHSTPLHQAVAGGHMGVVKLLVERGARLDIQDTIYRGTPLGWARHCDRPEIASYLEIASAKP